MVKSKQARSTKLILMTCTGILVCMGAWTLSNFSENGIIQSLGYREFIGLGLLLLVCSSIAVMAIVCLGDTSVKTFQRENFRRLAEQMGDILFEYFPSQKRIRWMSDLSTQLLGYLPGELTITPEVFTGLAFETDRELLAQAWKDLAKGNTVNLETRLKKKDDTWIWIRFTAYSIKDEGGRKGVGMVRKTQQLHAAEEALGEARRMETVGTMAGGIAHEFNNHLTPIRGYLELALADLGPDHDYADGLKIALERVHYCAELVGQIQAYGRKTLLMPQPVDLTRLVPTMARMAMSTRQKQAEKITLVEEFEPELPQALIDYGQFQQAITQLVNNAFDAMPGGGELTLAIREKYIDHSQGSRKAGSGSYLCVSVIDNGEGIRNEHLPSIFDPFFTTRGRAQAKGMGLSMVQGMVAQHKGYVEVESTCGQGTEVRLMLPVRANQTLAGDQAPKDKQANGMRILPMAKTGLLLVADDELPIRALVKRIYEREGWDVIEAADANRVLEMLEDKEKAPDLLVLDLTMPGPPPEETVEHIRSRKLKTKILLISGFSKNERISRLSLHKGVEYLAKPFSPDELLASVDALMAGEQSDPELQAAS
jgi:signal transduction histidine kinase/ActR/RegA family two-component response regulator